MHTFILTSEHWTGEIMLNYDEAGNLIDYQNRAELTSEQNILFLANLPIDLRRLTLLTDKTKAKAMKVENEITFDMFWQRYDDKLNSSKKRAKAKWDKMCKSEQAKAFNYIGLYQANIPHGTRKKFAETYLNAELWNN